MYYIWGTKLFSYDNALNNINNRALFLQVYLSKASTIGGYRFFPLVFYIDTFVRLNII